MYSVSLLAILLGLCLGIGLAAQSASHHIEGFLVESAGRGLVQSATALAESLNRVLFEHDLESQIIAQSPVLRRSDSDALGTYLRGLKSTWPEYMSLQVVDAGGTVIAATDSSLIGKNASQYAWYKTLLEGRRVDLRSADLFDHTRRMMLFPSTILGDEGQFLGVVVLQVGLQSMEFILDGAKRSAALRSPAARLDYQLVTNDGMVLHDSAPHEKPSENHAGMGHAMLNGSEKVGYREELHPQRHVAVVTGYAPVNRYGQVPGWQWTLLLSTDRETILTPFHRLVATTMIWGGMGLLIFVAILMWLIGRLKKASAVPQSEMAAATAGVSAKVRAPVQSASPTKAPHSLLRKPVASRTDDRPPASIEPVAIEPGRWEELRRWVRIAEVNRVCLFKNHREDGELWASRRYEWIGLGEVARTEWSQWFSWSLRAKGFSRWEHTLAQGQVISGAVTTFPPAEAAALMSCGIHTVLVVPLCIRGEWWGFVEFDHCFTDRVWSGPEEQGLRAMVELLQTVIQQAAGEEHLQRLLAIIDTVLESTADGILVVDGEGNLVNFNQRLVSLWNMPDAVTESRLTEEIMGWMMRQLKIPDVLLRTMSELGNEPDAESYDILELQDGRMVERLSKPRREGDQCDGRIWIFRESIALKPTTLSVHSSQ
ncbi:MAG: GAF domain-containing protein [Nitrospirales bacterium]